MAGQQRTPWTKPRQCRGYPWIELGTAGALLLVLITGLATLA